MLPFLLAADFMRADASDLQRDNFNIGSIGLGTGLRYRLRVDRTELTAGGVIGAQFSFDGYGSATGSSVLSIVEAVAQLNDVLVADGIVIGYRFRFQRWSMSRETADYQSVSHGLFLGVMF